MVINICKDCLEAVFVVSQCSILDSICDFPTADGLESSIRPTLAENYSSQDALDQMPAYAHGAVNTKTRRTAGLDWKTLALNGNNGLLDVSSRF